MIFPNSLLQGLCGERSSIESGAKVNQPARGANASALDQSFSETVVSTYRSLFDPAASDRSTSMHPHIDSSGWEEKGRDAKQQFGDDAVQLPQPLDEMTAFDEGSDADLALHIHGLELPSAGRLRRLVRAAPEQMTGDGGGLIQNKGNPETVPQPPLTKLNQSNDPESSPRRIFIADEGTSDSPGTDGNTASDSIVMAGPRNPLKIPAPPTREAADVDVTENDSPAKGPEEMPPEEALDFSATDRHGPSEHCVGSAIKEARSHPQGGSSIETAEPATNENHSFPRETSSMAHHRGVQLQEQSQLQLDRETLFQMDITESAPAARRADFQNPAERFGERTGEKLPSSLRGIPSMVSHQGNPPPEGDKTLLTSTGETDPAFHGKPETLSAGKDTDPTNQARTALTLDRNTSLTMDSKQPAPPVRQPDSRPSLENVTGHAGERTPVPEHRPTNALDSARASMEGLEPASKTQKHPKPDGNEFFSFRPTGKGTDPRSGSNPSGDESHEHPKNFPGNTAERSLQRRKAGEERTSLAYTDSTEKKPEGLSPASVHTNPTNGNEGAEKQMQASFTRFEDLAAKTTVETGRESEIPLPTAKEGAVDGSLNASGRISGTDTASMNSPEPSLPESLKRSVLGQLVNKASVRSLQDRSECRIRLQPEFLGNVRMTVSTQQDQVTIRIVADQASVKDSLESNLHMLRTELKNHGLTLDKIDVLTPSDADPQAGKESSYQSAKEQSFQNGRQQTAERNSDKENRRGEGSGQEEQPQRDRRQRRYSNQEGLSQFV